MLRYSRSDYSHRFHLKKKYGSAPATTISRIAKG